MHPGQFAELGRRGLAPLQLAGKGRMQGIEHMLQALRALRVPGAGVMQQAGRMGIDQHRADSALALLWLPQRLAVAIGTGQHPGQHEQQVRQPVEVLQCLAAHRLAAGQGDGLALGATDDGARQVAARGSFAPGRQDEFLQHRQAGVVVVQLLFQRRDIGGMDRGVAGDAQLGAQGEQLVLQVHDQRPHVLGQRCRQQQAERRIGLVDRAEGGNACVILGHALAVAEAGAAVVAGAGVDAREAMAHGAAQWRMSRRACWSLRNCSTASCRAAASAT
ncbi:hypothetical protein G6F57_014638 [Rhizopus arrhizus]|nr:hypothetical protein G6F57_014638 [Rhizopus arrhizus]